MKTKLYIFLFFITALAFCDEPGTKYLPPLTITKGGTYTGNYKSDDSQIPAIRVDTYEPVEITGCTIISSGIGIQCGGGTKLNVHHNNIKGQTPTGNGQWGRALDDYHPQYLIFEHNYVDHTGGIAVDHADTNTRSAIIRYNVFLDTDKRRTDKSEGEHRASIIFNTVLPVTGEISWNYFENLPNGSWVEDNINFSNSGGTKQSPYLIHDNYIKGAYPFPLTADHYTGSGITVEGSPDHHEYNNVSQHIRIYNNQVISTCNGGININAGHDIEARDNTIISSGMFPDGTPSDRFWGGTAVWNGSNLKYPEVFNNIVVKNNKIGYYRKGLNVPLPDRQDFVVTAGSPINIKPGDNIAMPNPITLQTELDEIPKWEKKLADNKISLGNVVSKSK